jgi:hypothetical protein
VEIIFDMEKKRRRWVWDREGGVIVLGRERGGIVCFEEGEGGGLGGGDNFGIQRLMGERKLKMSLCI